jgi:hypothetical protein
MNFDRYESSLTGKNHLEYVVVADAIVLLTVPQLNQLAPIEKKKLKRVINVFAFPTIIHVQLPGRPKTCRKKCVFSFSSIASRVYFWLPKRGKMSIVTVLSSFYR